MLVYYFKLMLKTRRIDNPTSQFIKWGITRNAVNKMFSNNVSHLRLSDIEILCKKLHCTPNDLLRYIPDSKPNPSNPIPLDALIRHEEEANIQELLSELDIDQLKKVSAMIDKLKEEDL
jgi:DNA-binding Xre family transcriptional regulator